MAAFIYYFPDRAQPLARNAFSDDDRKCGLDLLLRDASIGYSDYAAGPDGGRGTMSMVAANGGSEHMVFVNDEAVQRWVKVNPHYWVGMYLDARRPTPADLARPTQVDGEKVELAGQEWLLPVCGPVISKLPMSFQYVLNGSGWEWKASTRKEFLALQEECKRVIERFGSHTDEDANKLFAQNMEFCVSMLAVNYHVGRVEVSMLEVLTTESFGAIIRTAIGKTTFERQSKQEAASGTES